MAAPHIEQLHKEFPAVAVLGIGSESARALRQFAEKYGVTYPILLDGGGKVFRTYRGKYIPYSVVVNKKGVVTATFVGDMPDAIRSAVRNQLSAEAVSMSSAPQRLDLGAPPVIIGGRTYVPVRGVLEWSGASVGWDKGTRTITAKSGSWSMALAAGSGTQAPIRMIGGRAYVSLRDARDSLGLKLTYSVTGEGIFLKLPTRSGLIAR